MLIEDNIHISAPPDHVWAITIDIDAWPRWTPTVREARRLDDGPFGIGSQALLKQPAQSQKVWSVTEFTPGNSFIWETSGRFLRMRAKHLLIADDSGTDCITSVQLLGLLGNGLGPLLRLPIKLALRQENQALKAFCEAG